MDEFKMCCGTTCDKRKVQEQIDALAAERDALASQVHELRWALIEIRHSPDDRCSEIAATALDATPAACLAQVRAETVEECQLIVARTNTTYRENPGMGFSSTIEDKSAKQFKDECSKQLSELAERIRQGGAI